jgi:hypothetical protein
MQIEFFRNPLFSVLFLAAVPFLFAEATPEANKFGEGMLSLSYGRLRGPNKKGFRR